MKRVATAAAVLVLVPVLALVACRPGRVAAP